MKRTIYTGILGVGQDIGPLDSEAALDEWDLGPLLARVSDRASITEREWKAIEAILRAQSEGRSWKPAHRIAEPAWRLNVRRKAWANLYHELIVHAVPPKAAREDVAAHAGMSVRALLKHFADLKKVDPEFWAGEVRRTKGSRAILIKTMRQHFLEARSKEPRLGGADKP